MKFVVEEGVSFVKRIDISYKVQGLGCMFPVGKLSVTLKSKIEGIADNDLAKKVEAAIDKAGGIENLPKDENGLYRVALDDVAADGEKAVAVIGVDEELSKLGKAIDSFLESIDASVLEKLKKVQGYDKVIADMETYWKKFRGGKFQLEYAAKLIDEGKTIKFEVSNLSDDLKRVYDIEVTGLDKTGNTIIQNIELKNWNNFYPETIKSQFIKDLVKMQNLGDIQWIFSKTATIGDMSTLKANVLKALKKADGSAVDELEDLFDNINQVNKFKEIFGAEVNTSNDLLKKLNNDNVFDEIFEIVE